mgnify:CR=1 FL=1
MQETKEIKRFDIKQEQKLINALNKIFSEAKDIFTEEEILEMQEVVVSDECNVCMIVGLTTETKIILRRFKDKYDRIIKLPNLDYTQITQQGARYSNSYLKYIINIMYITSDKTIFYTLKDYPLTLENEHFKIILAPRCGGD